MVICMLGQYFLIRNVFWLLQVIFNVKQINDLLSEDGFHSSSCTAAFQVNYSKYFGWSKLFQSFSGF